MKINFWHFETKTKFSIVPSKNDPSSVVEVQDYVFLVEMTKEEYESMAREVIIKGAMKRMTDIFARALKGING